jgi:hypothetical protein
VQSLLVFSWSDPLQGEPRLSNNYDYLIYIYNIPEDIVYETTEGGCMITVTSYTDVKVTKKVDRKTQEETEQTPKTQHAYTIFYSSKVANCSPVGPRRLVV